MAWSPEDRSKFLRALNETESRLLVFYKYLLYFLIVAVSAVAVLFYHSVTKDAFRDFLRAYGGIIYFIFLLWAVGQLFIMSVRISPHRTSKMLDHAISPKTQTRERDGFPFSSARHQKPPQSPRKRCVLVSPRVQLQMRISSMMRRSLKQKRTSARDPASIWCAACLTCVTKTGVLPNSRFIEPTFGAKLNCERLLRPRPTKRSLRHPVRFWPKTLRLRRRP